MTRQTNGKGSANSEKGIVYIIDGAGGSGFLPFVMRGILRDSGYRLEHFRWSAGYMRIIKDLTNRAVNRERATELSLAITQYRSQYPDRQIHVIAKSAGTAIALWAMSDLEERTLDRVVLLSPAVSPQFPLEAALASARQDVYSFWSPYDALFLGLGTSLFGTADGVAGKSAGLVGFSRHSKSGGSLEKSLVNAQLREVRWDPSMIASWHVGDHSGTSMPPFIRKYVMPLLEPEISTEGHLQG